MCMETVEFWQLRVTNGAKTPLSYPLVSRFIHLFIHMLENIFDKSLEILGYIDFCSTVSLFQHQSVEFDRWPISFLTR